MIGQKVFYTDGACSGNPGNGGWCYVEVIESECGISTNVVTGNKRDTTNNEMELTATYKAVLAAYKEGCKKVIINSDSFYVINPIEKEWIYKWCRNDWNTAEGNKVKNVKMWKNIYKLIYEKGMHVTVNYIKGHSGDLVNELADRMAVKARKELGS